VSGGTVLLRGEANLSQARWDVWAALNNPAVVSRCVAGCDSAEHLASNMLFVRFAPTSGDRDGLGRRALVELLHATPPERMRIRIRSATRAGSFEANLTITLHDRGECTLVSYEGSIIGPAASHAHESAMRASSQSMASKFVSGITSTLDRVR
jgi:carbon monoxide dehydrogenase subunit G